MCSDTQGFSIFLLCHPWYIDRILPMAATVLNITYIFTEKIHLQERAYPYHVPSNNRGKTLQRPAAVLDHGFQIS